MEIGLRELRQHASDLVRRAEQGESITVTVSGRPAARLVPVLPASWRDAGDLSALYTGGAPDPSWADDRESLDAGLQDPFPG
jgi:prevent-host-death family protein